jgi:ATP-dependent helicase Lhr and Lhr-like helicase
VPSHIIPISPDLSAELLPDRFRQWFAGRGWSPREHQLALLEKARDDRSALLIAPTGAGKTLAGFLPTLVELSAISERTRSAASSPVRSSPLPPRLVRRSLGEGGSGGEGSGMGGGSARADARHEIAEAPPTPDPSPPRASRAGGGEKEALAARVGGTESAARAGHSRQSNLFGERSGVISTGRGVQRSRGLHTLYISPLKALAVDIARNLETPIAEMNLPIRVETRTGDTPVSRRQRQRRYPPDILLTTPEQLALLLSSDDAPFLFSSLKRIVLDELHALVTSKRGDLLSLGLARLWRLAPQMRAIGLSATVAEPESLARFLVPQRGGEDEAADIVIAGGAAAPVVEMLDTRERLPWAGHGARHALPEVYDLIKRNKTTLVFVNTRSQAEMLFQDLWRMNDDGLAIALHHGSLDVAQRRKVEDAMAAGKLRGVVCTSSLDLGVDWGARAPLD